MNDNQKTNPATHDAAVRSQIGAVVRRSVQRHCQVRNDAFFDLLAKDLAKVGHAVVRTDAVTDHERALVVKASGVSDKKLRMQVAAMRAAPSLKNVVASDLTGLPEVIEELLARRLDANEPNGFRAGADVTVKPSVTPAQAVEAFTTIAEDVDV